MFTGLIETTATVRSVDRRERSRRIGCEPAAGNFTVEPGASVSVDGVCLTVESIAGNIVYFTAVHETLSRSTLADLRTGMRVNIERALMVSQRLDGHFVLGHVDATAGIVSDRRVGESVVRTIAVPPELQKYTAVKGSIAVDGISLTIARCGEGTIDIACVPYTLGATTLLDKRAGDRVNMECDVLARYCERLLQGGVQRRDDGEEKGGRSLLDAMEEYGY